MKIYLGIRPSLLLRKKIARILAPSLRASSLPLRMQEIRHMHITTHFIGEVTEKSLTEIVRQFNQISLPHTEEIMLGGDPPTGTFGADVLYLHVTDTNGILHALKKEGQRLAPVRETYDSYTPHLTLARNPHGREMGPLLHALGAHPFTIPYTPNEVLLIHSHERKGKKYHDIIARRRLFRGKKPLERGVH